MGVAHLRAHSSICGSRLSALRRMAAVAIRGPATRAVADIGRRLPATADRITHPAGVVPRPMVAAVVDTMAAEVEEVVEDTTAAEAVVVTPVAAVEVVVTREVEAATQAEAIAKNS